MNVLIFSAIYKLQIFEKQAKEHTEQSERQTKQAKEETKRLRKILEAHGWSE